MAMRHNYYHIKRATPWLHNQKADQMMKFFAATILFLLFSFAVSQYAPNWDSLDKRPLPSWYDEVKFGIFMHWGVYSVPSFSSEWFWEQWKGEKLANVVEFMNKNYPPDFTYADFAPMFKAEMFDPDQWVELFKASGAKYVVLTSKHHEGFTNWPTQTSWNWNSVDTGPHMDLVGNLSASVRKNSDIHFGLYFSQFEWFNPLYLQDKANGFKTQTYVDEVSLPQMHEIVNMYKPELIWSDGDWEAPDTYWNSTEFLAWLYNESPVKDTIVVNDRWGKGTGCKHGDYYCCTDRYNPRTLQKHKWENAMTVDRSSWGFRREAVWKDFLTIESILENLVSTVSCGGNLLLNIGPTHDGRIVPIFEERLLQMGSWLKNNGESIYKSKPWTHQNDSLDGNVWYTMNITDKSVYAIALKWPDNNVLTLGSVKGSSSSVATLLGYGKVQSMVNSNGQLQITMPSLPLDSELMWAWSFKLENVSPAAAIPHQDRMITKDNNRFML